MKYLVCLCLLTATLLPSNSEADVVEIMLSDFDTPSILDFESAPLGPIDTSDPIFSNFGISGIAPISPVGAPRDEFNGGGTGNALFFNSDVGLFVERIGGNGLLSNHLSGFDIDLARSQFRFGLAVNDTAGDFDLDFSSNDSSIGMISVSMVGGNPRYFESTQAFDSVSIVQTSQTDGWGVDNITVEAIPEPSSGILFLCATVVGVGFRRNGRHKHAN